MAHYPMQEMTGSTLANSFIGLGAATFSKIK